MEPLLVMKHLLVTVTHFIYEYLQTLKEDIVVLISSVVHVSMLDHNT